jgi:hypothetical protein
MDNLKDVSDDDLLDEVYARYLNIVTTVEDESDVDLQSELESRGYIVIGPGEDEFMAPLAVVQDLARRVRWNLKQKKDITYELQELLDAMLGR